MTSNPTSAGFIQKTTDRVAFTRDMTGRYRGLIDAADRVLVKPNIVSHELYPTTTHPEVLEAVLDALDGKDVVVADGLAVDILNTHRTLIAHPLHHVCEKRGRKVLDLHHTPSATYKSPRKFSVALSRTPFNFDFIISLPVLKSHGVCTMTGALKNQFGLTTKAERIKTHSGLKNIHKTIAEINAIRCPDLFIIDAVETLTVTNEVRHGGKKANLGYMLAGTDPVALDARGLDLLVGVDDKLWGKVPEDVKHLKFAAEYGVGDFDALIEEI